MSSVPTFEIMETDTYWRAPSSAASVSSRIQLARDRSNIADCKPLYVKGARGTIFKIRLSSHVYTLVARGIEEHDIDHLQESKVYNRLRSLQGNCIPVCLGTSNLGLPYYYDCGVYVTMLFLSWAGRPLYQYINPENEYDVMERATSALKLLHNLEVLHKDVKPHNMLWDEHRNKFMLVDFERAEIQTRFPLGIITANHKTNRQGDIKTAVKEDDFDREMSTAISCIRTMASLS
jgi:serine/threonine protein kinase